MKPKRALPWKGSLASPEPAKLSEPQSHLSVLLQGSPGSLGCSGLCPWITGTWCWGKDVPPVHGCCWQSRAAIPGSAGKKTLRTSGNHIWKLLLTSSAAPESSPERSRAVHAAGEGQMEPQWLSPCSRACDSANVSTWSDLHGEIRTKQMLLAQMWWICHLPGLASTSTTLRWLKKAKRVEG